LDEWLDKAIRPPRRAPLTYTTYAGVVKNYLKPAFGHVLLQQLTPLLVERYYADSKLAQRTVGVHHAILTTALKAAVTSGILRHNVANRATNKPNMRTTTSDVRKNCWSRDEAFTFLATVRQEGNAQNLAFFALALDGGLRIGELLGLRWTDLEGNTLSVDRQLLRRGKDEETGKDCLITSLPKTRRTLRMDLSEETVSLLREHKRQQAELKLKNRLRYADHGLMFAQQWEQMQSKHATLGWPLNRTSVGTMLTRLCNVADVKRISPHGMRHTCATLLLLAGVQPHVVQRRLGHASVEMTLNVYSHVLPSMESDAASRLSKLLHG
jgi:integrase